MRLLFQLAWWMLPVRSTLAILFGILLLLWPEIPLVVLISLFGAYALADGAADVIAAITSRRGQKQWPLMFVHGVISIVVALAVLRLPEIAAPFIIPLIAGHAIILGMLETIAALQLWRERQRAWVFTLSALIAVLFGALLLAWPGATTLGLHWLVGGYKALGGLLLLFFTFQVPRWKLVLRTR